MVKRKNCDREASFEASWSDEPESPPRAKQRPSNPSSPLQVCTIHRVHCDRTKNHEPHSSITYYEDDPRLFEGDCKASALRGLAPIDDISEYLGSRPHLKFVFYRIYSFNSYHNRLEPHFRPLERPENPFNQSILPYFYRLDRDGDPAKSHDEAMLISSEELLHALEYIANLNMDTLTALDDPQNTRILVTHLYQYRGIGKDHSLSKTDDMGSVELVSVFMEFIEEMFGEEYDEADALFAIGQVTKHHLPKLFTSGELLVTMTKDQFCGYSLDIVNKYTVTRPLVVSCSTWKFDGRFWKTHVEFRIDIPSDDIAVAITSLSIYPLKFATAEVREDLAKRGRKFWSLRNGSYVSYTDNTKRKDANMVRPRFMIDMLTYQELHGDPSPAQPSDYLSDDMMEAEEPPSEDFFFLLPATIQGFGFKHKDWQLLNVSQIGSINWNEEAFDHLVLQSTKKELVRALVKKHSSIKESMDIIEGKGNGLILLLHGGPGTGKTLTAESVAELTHRPLYRVTCGDVGKNAEEVEQYLESAFYLGKVWKCVVLLDEADVFLEERTRQDLKRNALVSVFLRLIEYYDGILVLTSNRIGTFDEAFKSRVQLIVHYPNLQKDERRRIWSTFISGLQNTNVKAHIAELQENIGELSKHDLNGREIRNSIQTASLLAQFRKKRLSMEHLRDVIAVSDEFKGYLREKYGDDEEYAQSSRIR